MIVLIDNYDSFTYNLVQRLGELDPERLSQPGEMRVLRNDKTSIAEIEGLKPTHVIISPGPCTPKEAGISGAVLRHFGPKIPTLGVCLGHQCIGDAWGGVVERNWRLMHGKTSPIHHDGKGVFAGLANPFEATRYHSLVIRPGTVPADFEVCGVDGGGGDHGGAAQAVAAAWGAVSSRVILDAGRAQAAGEFFEDVTGRANGRGNLLQLRGVIDGVFYDHSGDTILDR